MEKKFSQTHRGKIATKQKDSWKDPSKRVEQKKRIAAKRLLKGIVPDRIVPSTNPLNIETARQAIIDEIKRLDDQVAKFEPMVQRRDKLSTVLDVLNGLR